MCANNADVPMVDADDIVIEALLDDVLDLSMMTEAVDEALEPHSRYTWVHVGPA